MTDTLDSIFNNIYLSEQESKAQHEYLSNLKSQILSFEKELCEKEQLCATLREKTTRKIKRLSSREIMLKTVTIRHELLQERIRELRLEKEMLIKNKAELKIQLTAMRNEFCIETARFNEEFGFPKKPSKTSFTHAKRHTYEHTEGQTKASLVSSNEDLNRNEIERNEHEFEEMKALLFDVDFNSSPSTY